MEFPQRILMENGEPLYVTGNRPNIWSVRSGCACDPDTWNLRRLPRDGDRVGVAAGHRVTFTGAVEFRTLVYAGTVTFAHQSSVRYGTITGLPGGTFVVGSPARRVACCFRHVPMPFDADDVGEFGNGIIWTGRDSVAVYGEDKTPWITYGADVPNDWSGDDEVVVSGDRRHASVYVYLTSHHHLRTLRGRSERCVVANLTRSVEFCAALVGTRPHLMLMHGSGVLIGCAIERHGRTDKARLLGPDNLAGRYALHVHRGGESRRTVLSDVVVAQGPGWGIVNHSSNVDCRDAVVAGVQGAGFVTEAANEVGCWRECLAVNIRADHSPQDSLRDAARDRWHAGHGFVACAEVTLADCYAADTNIPFAWMNFGLTETIGGVDRQAEYEGGDGNTARRRTRDAAGLSAHVYSRIGVWSEWKNFRRRELTVLRQLLLTGGAPGSRALVTSYDRGWRIVDALIDGADIGNFIQSLPAEAAMEFVNVTVRNVRQGHTSLGLCPVLIDGGSIAASEVGVECVPVGHPGADKRWSINSCPIDAPIPVQLVDPGEPYGAYSAPGVTNAVWIDGVRQPWPWET